MAEESFPRGGSEGKSSKVVLKGLKSTDNDLFQISNQISERKKSKKKDKKETESAESTSTDHVVVEKFTPRIAVENMLILGRVKAIHDYKIIVGLPENVLAELSITDICPAYTAALKAIADNVELDDTIGSLDELFVVGQIICCCVKKVERNNKKVSIQLTIDPAAVNRDISVQKLSKNHSLHAVVKSKEDHGYSLDLGIQGRSAFVQNSDAEKFSGKRALSVGMPLLCSITDSSIRSMQSGTQRAVCVKLRKSHPKLSESSDLKNLLPGTVLTGTVTSVQPLGIVVKFCEKFTGYVHRHHLNADISKFTDGQEVILCVLYHQPLIGVTSMSMLSHLTESDSVKSSHFKLVKVGDTIQSARVLSVEEKSGVLLKLKSDIHGYLPLKYVHDNPDKCKVTELPKTGIHCRVVDFDFMNNVAIVSSAKSWLERKIMNINDCKPGEIIEGKVERFAQQNIILRIAGLCRGIVPFIHNADVPLKKPELKYKINSNLKCRILKIEDGKRLILTAKECLVKTQLPLLNSYEKVKIGMVVDGVIVKINPSGLLVLFYDEIKGFVHKSEAGVGLDVLDETFYDGQVVKCRVLSSCSETRKIRLSLNLVGQQVDSVKKMELQADVDAQVIHSCKVLKISDRGLNIRVGEMNGFIPVHHLSDNFVNCQHLLKLYKPHQTIDEVALFERATLPIFTLKKSILHRLREEQLPENSDDLLPGTTVCGVVKNSAKFGIFIQISPNLRALCLRKLIADQYTEDADQLFPPGMSVLTHIKEVEGERNRILCSLRMSDCYSGNTRQAIDLLSSYLEERSIIVKHYKENGTDAMKSMLHFDVGSVVEIIIDTLNDHGAIGRELASNVRVICTVFHMTGANVKVGEIRKAVVLYQDLAYTCLEVTLSTKVVKAISHRSEGPSNKVREDNLVDAEVLLVRPEFVLIGLKGWAEFKLAYAPAQKCFNDVTGSQLFEPGFSDKVVVKITEDPVICNWKAFEHRKLSNTGHTREKVKNVERHKLQVGSKVRALVKEVLPFQMNIRIGSVSGRIFASELEAEDLVHGESIKNRFKAGDSLDVVVIGFRCPKSQKPMSDGADHSKGMPECSLRRNRLDGDFTTKFEEGQQIAGFYYQTKDERMEFRVSPNRIAFCQCVNADIDVEDMEKPDSSGAYYPLFITKIKGSKMDVTMIPQPSVKSGNVVMGCVLKVKKGSLLLRLSGNFRGIVTPTEMSDEYEDNIISKFKVGEYHRCKLLTKVTDEDTQKGYPAVFQASMRRSRCAPLLTGIEPKDKVIENVADLIPNEIVRGYVYSCKQNTVIVLLGNDIYGVAKNRNLPDHQPPQELTVAYPIWKVVTVKIMSVNKERVTVSLKSSDTGVTDQNLSRKRRNSEGESVEGSSVAPSRKRKVSESDSVTGRKRRDSECETVRIRRISDSDSPALGTRKRRLSEMSENSDSPALGTRKRRLSEMSQTNETAVVADNSKEIDIENLGSLPILNPESDSSSSEEVEIPKPPAKKKKKKKKSDESGTGAGNKAPLLEASQAFAWVSDFTLPRREEDESESSDEDTEKTQSSGKKDFLEEKKLMELENRLLDTNRMPETEDEFERMVIQSPDSSLVWMQYMAHNLKMAEIDKARKIAERALKTISFREEQEKLNVWVALMNLENTYGTAEQLKDVFDRAVQMNDSFKVHSQLVKIYENTDKYEQAERLYSSMVRQFGRKKEVWIGFSQFYFRQNRSDSARKILERSLKTLDKRDHMEVVTKFGRLEFENNHNEKAVDLFERVLVECPKRIDVWMVYIDLLIKFSQVEKVRSVFSKVLDVKIPAKKMKSIFKKWLEFETKFGDDLSVSNVKQRAADYAKSNLG